MRSLCRKAGAEGSKMEPEEAHATAITLVFLSSRLFYFRKLSLPSICNSGSGCCAPGRASGFDCTTKRRQCGQSAFDSRNLVEFLRVIANPFLGFSNLHEDNSLRSQSSIIILSFTGLRNGSNVLYAMRLISHRMLKYITLHEQYSAIIASLVLQILYFVQYANLHTRSNRSCNLCTLILNPDSSFSNHQSTTFFLPRNSRVSSKA